VTYAAGIDDADADAPANDCSVEVDYYAAFPRTVYGRVRWTHPL
jgi:hypothetical protein